MDFLDQNGVNMLLKELKTRFLSGPAKMGRSRSRKDEGGSPHKEKALAFLPLPFTF